MDTSKNNGKGKEPAKLIRNLNGSKGPDISTKHQAQAEHYMDALLRKHGSKVLMLSCVQANLIAAFRSLFESSTLTAEQKDDHFEAFSQSIARLMIMACEAKGVKDADVIACTDAMMLFTDAIATEVEIESTLNAGDAQKDASEILRKFKEAKPG